MLYKRDHLFAEIVLLVLQYVLARQQNQLVRDRKKNEDPEKDGEGGRDRDREGESRGRGRGRGRGGKEGEERREESKSLYTPPPDRPPLRQILVIPISIFHT